MPSLSAEVENLPQQGWDLTDVREDIDVVLVVVVSDGSQLGEYMRDARES